MTDAQWALIAPLLPPPGTTTGRGGRGEKWPRRLVLDAIFYLVRGGIAWAALPLGFPPYKTVFDWFTRWKKTGVWADLHDALRDQTGLLSVGLTLLLRAEGRQGGCHRAREVPARVQA